MSLFYFIQRNDQIKREKMWEDFQSWLFFFSQLEFLLFCAARNRILKSHPFFHELWKNQFALDFLSGLPMLWDFITVLDVKGKWEEATSKGGSKGV